MKNQKGITLIALIITIIVMLILVGVSVSVALNTGLFTSAGGAAKNTQAAAEAETALSNGTIKIEGQEGEISIDDYVASLKGEDAKWTLTDEDENGEISVGDLVTHKEKTTEQFYVIGFSADNTKVNLLAKYNLKKEGTEIILKQDTAGELNPYVFSSTNYWSSVPGIAYPDANGKYPDLNDETTYPKGEATSIITVAKDYGTSLEVAGRLMTVEEVVALGGSLSDFSTAGCPDFVNTTNFWLGNAGDYNYVTFVSVGTEEITAYDYDCGLNGVRPVIEVPKSSIN